MSKRIFIPAALVITLAGPSLVIANDINAKQFEGLTVTGLVELQNLPIDVEKGSVSASDAEESELPALASLSANKAIEIAETATGGKTVEMQLGHENGFVIWEVTTNLKNNHEAQLKIDAGNGRLLAAEMGDSTDHDQTDRYDERQKQDDDGHIKWKFWEHDHESDKDD